MIEKAFKELYPNEEFNHIADLKYSRQFSAYNANIRLYNNTIEVRMCVNWKDIGEEIQIGLIQHLLQKILKRKKQDTFYTNLYSNFIKNLADATPKTLADPILVESFNRVNNEYFQGGMQIPNLKWGTNSYRQLGLYNYQNDSITISSIFKEHSQVTDYILYHELLHKQEKFTHKNGRSHHHTKRFRELERQFKDQTLMEEKIKHIIRNSRSNGPSRAKTGLFKWF